MDSLPVDVLCDILLLVPFHAVLAVRCTSKTLYELTHLRTLWVLLFRTHVLEPRLPCPHSGPLIPLSAHDLESLTRRALALRRTWLSTHPVPRRHTTLSAPADPTARVIFLQFLPGRSNRWLISVRMTARPRSYLLQCWDVASEQPTCVAALTHADGPYRGVVLNSDPTSPAVLAMQSAQTETFSIRFDAHDPESAFETQATIDGIRELHLLSGSTLVTRDDDGPLSLRDIADLASEKLQLLNPSLVQPDDRVQAIHIAHDYALVVRFQSIEIYSTLPRPSFLAPRGTPIAYPFSQFKFQWRTDTVVLCAQHAPPSLLPPPIHLLVRFGSIYPWPVNVLHHYCLAPNPTYPIGRIPSPSLSPVTTEYNLPYDPHPYPTHTIGSPVRLFGQAAMALGRYGTALWLDNHTQAWLEPSERGQRLAGKVFRDGGPRGCVGNRAEIGMSVGTGGTTTPEPTTTSSDPGGIILFGIRDDDVWTRIAMEEEAGRIALGHVNGEITLLEY